MIGTFEESLLLVLRQTTSRILYSILAGSHFLRDSSLVSRLQSPVSAFRSHTRSRFSVWAPFSSLVSRLSAVPVALSYLVSLVFGLGSIVSPYLYISSLIDRFAVP
ncbi:BZ3500_MvSof-1268-A1-R1_C044g00118 [Microbotryum saponariae]|uniref:BZ3500_MvSof-1268-A1-R1_C039g00070 protein n=1 Tax=Microbotryum saponariae TaxID=289078 RepID=A0A2X0LJI6_9BASI|nr:BZ3500_MvSof-1268-A1-R1_C039g00070 [Microbotryum saponariae]SDA04152.1 BZ3500_MvSof-1268-A1-R1_C044g00118 [Microbotryum saponariae]SDA07231.1 BZ3501_MvSof-1269-A2-R1_Chr4-3g07278 [Microbotryum saponariae]SDA08505.1 BZ3501_MvSof-1269-A2-R1_C33g00125 [Microbotryum saponariae]